MFQNYFKIILRGMFRQKMYTLIKIGGFALGIAACLLIALFIRDELSYDKQIPHGDQIYRVVEVQHDNGGIVKETWLPAPFANALKENFPEVEKAGRFNAVELFGAGSKEIRRSDQLQNTHEDGFIYADQELLDIFQGPMVYGNRVHALDEPNTIVISKHIADKYFPNENPVGKTFIINNNVSKPYRIGGVMDFPSNSHFRYNFLITLKGLEFWNGEQKNWGCYNYQTYVLLRPGTDVSRLEAKLSDITKKYLVPLAQQQGLVDAAQLQEKISFKLQPLGDIYLRSEGIQDGLSHGDIRFIWIFGIIAVFILIIACINFINLSTAKSANRAKEVGLKKTIGALRSSLIGQYLAESLIYSILSFILGILLAIVFLPFFNVLSAKSLQIPWSDGWWILLLLVSASFVVGTLAGLYPSFYLSSFKPAGALKGSLNKESKSPNMRSALVIFQFTASIVLIIGTLVIYRQVGYILHKKVGFDKEQVLLLHGANTMGNQVTTFKNELLKLPEVKNVSISDYLPITGTKRNGNPFWKEGETKTENAVSGQKWMIDQDYLETMGMKILEGRNFSANMPTDSKAAIINQTMVKELGLRNPIGTRITNSEETFEVIGVVEDFNFDSVKEKIKAICLTLGKSPNIVSVKVSTSDMAGAIRSITKVWNQFSVNQPIRYSFLDKSFAMMYADVQRTGRIFSTFALLAIIVACLGLFALSSFMIEQRTKEIGIRKVNGAKIAEAITMLNKDFIQWVAIAFIIACPIAWYAMHKWLENFAYKIELNWWVFVAAGGIAVVIALFTVSWQSFRAATRNPVEALRYE
jgi:putative ABC transport system permease protein